MLINDKNSTEIYYSEESFCFYWDNEWGDNARLATRAEYKSATRDIGSIFEALEPGECVKLKEGYFILDDDLNLGCLLGGNCTPSTDINASSPEEALEQCCGECNGTGSVMLDAGYEVSCMNCNGTGYVAYEKQHFHRECTCGSGEPWTNCSANTNYCG